MTPNPMKPRVNNVSDNVVVEQIATDLSMQYNPRTQQALLVMNFRGVMLVDDVVADLAGSDRTQVIITTENHAATKFATGVADPVSGADLSNITAAGVMAYLKAMAARAYDDQFAEAENAPNAADETTNQLPKRIEG